MSCIVGIVDSDQVWIGGDSAVSENDVVKTLKHAKVFRRGKFLLGYVGDLRVGQLIRYKMKIPKIGSKGLMKYMSTSFVDALRKCLKENGAIKIEDSVEESSNKWLVGIDGRLFEIGHSFEVSEEVYTAIGSGQEFATGVLHDLITHQRELGYEEIIKRSLGASAHFCASVAGPFLIIKK